MGKHIFVITGPTGSGKTTIKNYLNSQYQIPTIITHTTRPKRTNEVDGQDYYFEDHQSFSNNNFLESVEYAGNKYGSSYEGLEKGFEKSNLVCIVLDTKGAITYKNKLGEKVVPIFLKVKSNRDLKKRMLKRGDDINIINQRLISNEYKRDLEVPDELKESAVVFENNDLKSTKQKLDQLIKQYI